MRVEFGTVAVQVQLARGQRKTLAQQIGPDAGTAHARTKGRIVAPAVAQIFDTVQHTLGAIRKMRLQPGFEDLFHFPGQAQHGVAGVAGASRAGLLQDVLEGFVVDERDDRRHQHTHRHAGLRQGAHRLQPAVRRRGARFQRAGHGGIQRGDADEYRDQLLARQVLQQVEVALDQGVLGNDGKRVAGLQQQFEHAARQAPGTLDGLVGVGGRTDVDGRCAVARTGQLGAQRGDRVGLGHQPGFEVEPRRIAQVGMRGPRVAVHAAVLAAPIGVGRHVERDVGGVVAREHLAGFFGLHDGARGRRLGASIR
ncbi:Uncharacterised protein [Bordetella pertussis]|nr:Uncharacterised protein [Bordetella pertussis]CFN49112.1 Uncharacterised protein [Bordetella pertussis]CFN98064.1 Uncharacterised protein [Bordetella pertussis]CFO33649.1 Uncharacterised protein [Bordetella pertussis]CFP50883.1 Uncharacterised protein [Bordetella pertussis]